MPSFPHEFLVALFRECPELAPYLLSQVLHIELPPYTEIRVEEASFTQLRPTEYRADLVLTLRSGGPVMGIIIEVQLQVDPRKEYSWVVYAGEFRARIQGDVVVLVFSDNEQVVRWASQPIRLGGRSVFQVEVRAGEDPPGRDARTGSTSTGAGGAVVLGARQQARGYGGPGADAGRHPWTRPGAQGFLL